MRGDSIQRYLRIFGITATMVYLVVNQSFSQQFFVGGKTCVDNTVPTSPTATTGGCNEPTNFFDTDLASTAWNWSFTDSAGTTAPVALTAIRNPNYFFPKVGTYTISLVRTVGGVAQPPVTKNIKVGTFPTQPLFNSKKKADTTVCDGKTTLDPYKGTATPKGVTYLWFPKGETTPTIDVDSSGCYSVEVFTPEGCSRIAQITVKYCLQQANKPDKKDIWYFGNLGSLEFTKTSIGKPPWDSLANSGTVFTPPANNKFSYGTQPTTGNLLNSPQAMAEVFGPQGNLLFYTDGKTILTGDNKPVPALPPLTNTLNGDSATTQSVLIVPKAACNECPHHQYYVFTQDSLTKMLTYSVVDMRYNNQKGEIVQKDVPVYYPVGERITGVTTTDSSGFWILTHDATNNNFVVMKLDSTGLTQNVQATGLPEASPESNQGYLHFSSKGDKVAIAVSDSGKNYVEIYKFDRDTGKLSTPTQVTLPPAPPPVYGVEFSPDEEKVYVTLKGDPTSSDTVAQKSFLYQLNINLPTAAQISASKIKIDSSKTVAFGALQLDPNGESIYMAVDGTNLMYSILFPDILGGAKFIGYDKPPIGGTPISGTSHIGLPNVIKAKPSDNDSGLSATFMNTCLNSTTVFSATPICNPLTNKYDWNFGDGVTQETDSKDISHKYKKAGKYYVTLTVKTYEKVINTGAVQLPGILGQAVNSITRFCKDSTVKDSIYIRPSPATNLGDTVYVCVLEGQSKILNATATGGTNFTYFWKPTSETTPTIEVSAIGVYRVHIENQEGCKTDTFSVVRNGCEPVVLVPNAFTPNEDGQNEKLQVISKYITDFELRIFNRWGEQVYYTDNPSPDSRWDGSYNGLIYAPMNYAYVVQYKSKDFPQRPEIIKRGGILVAQ